MVNPVLRRQLTLLNIIKIIIKKRSCPQAIFTVNTSSQVRQNPNRYCTKHMVYLFCRMHELFRHGHIKGLFAPRTITITIMKIFLKVESPHYSSNDNGTEKLYYWTQFEKNNSS